MIQRKQRKENMLQKILHSRWKLTLQVLPYALLIVALKLVIHRLGWEFINVGSLFTTMVSANIFLIGFLISGVLVDYKEAEKIPGEIASSLETINDECSIIIKNKNAKVAKDCQNYIGQLCSGIVNWFYKKEKTGELLNKISGLNHYYGEFEPLTQANFIARMKQEQSTIRRLVNRAHAIRETSFNQSAYSISELITIVLAIGLILAKVEPFYEGVFFVAFIPFVMIYMILLIKDLDNPFDYYSKDKEATDEVSLKHLQDLEKKLTSK